MDKKQEENKEIKSPEAKPEQIIPTVQDFIKEYEELSKRMGFNIVAKPVWIARDDGTFSMQIKYEVQKA